MFKWFLEKFGYRKIIKAPTYSEYVNKKMERVEYLRNMARPLMQCGVKELINDGHYISEIVKYLYSYNKLEVSFEFNDWDSIKAKGYEYEFTRYDLSFTFHKKYKVNDIDYRTMFFEELKNGLKQYELTIQYNKDRGNYYIIPENKEMQENADYCNKIMAVS